MLNARFKKVSLSLFIKYLHKNLKDHILRKVKRPLVDLRISKSDYFDSRKGSIEKIPAARSWIDWSRSHKGNYIQIDKSRKEPPVDYIQNVLEKISLKPSDLLTKCSSKDFTTRFPLNGKFQVWMPRFFTLLKTVLLIQWCIFQLFLAKKWIHFCV